MQRNYMCLKKYMNENQQRSIQKRNVVAAFAIRALGLPDATERYENEQCTNLDFAIAAAKSSNNHLTIIVHIKAPHRAGGEG